jgi:hypothetical protein
MRASVSSPLARSVEEVDMLVIAGAFSIGMLPTEECAVRFRKVSPEEARKMAEGDEAVWSVIRHPATRDIAFDCLRLAPDRVIQIPTVTLNRGMNMLVFMPVWRGGRPLETREYSLEEIHELAESVEIWHVQLVWNLEK